MKNSNELKSLSTSAKLASLMLFSVSVLSGCSLTEFVSGSPSKAQPTNEQSSTSRKRSVEEVYAMTPSPQPTQSSQVVYSSKTKRPIAQRQPETNDDRGSLAQHSLTGAEHSVVVEEYIERMATDLINNLATSNSRTKPVIGVTSFVDFNNNLKTVTPFGNRIAEHFINELQRSGFIVADYKVRDTISVGQNGDLVFSRNTQELNGAESMTHVLAGNIMYQEKGLKIIARVVDFDHKWVIASSSVFMPYFILDTIVPSNAKQTVY